MVAVFSAGGRSLLCAAERNVTMRQRSRARQRWVAVEGLAFRAYLKYVVNLHEICCV
jgi:hypothetical protein